ncbi:alpha/beta hydrolase [Flavimaricola marinus]|uniref:Carboxylesterase NlhH n=1 Tax=Flavimaricola marinus TaxID=1819565 RepID=A0A238LBP3_9RHOB|nr:alpha/beta hydrolase [Flavimaricola marinus]SMY06340.1 Carboxylesterase NlhH [Flavimaricola marinus]
MMHAMAYATGWVLPRGVRRDIKRVPRQDGSSIKVEVFRPENAAGPLPVVLHLHGGGYAIGAPRQDYRLFARLMAARPSIIVAPHYRRSLEEPYPAALDDCHDVLLWLKTDAAALGATDHPAMVMGLSAGGGLAAALCLLSRDRGTGSIGAMFTVGAMLDHRTFTTDIDPANLSWSAGKNRLAWRLYLDGEPATPYAAPSCAGDLTDLPPAFGIAGDCDLFHAENVDYFSRLADAGVAAEFHSVAGGYHGVEVFAPAAEPGRTMSGLIGDVFGKAIGTCLSRDPVQP